VRFVVDAQLPPVLVRFLISAGHQADHVADVGLAAASDGEIWRCAQECGATIITKDEDFLSLRALRSDGLAIVWFASAIRQRMPCCG
jgi:predicted nuclease of predicted toxin-antitoxin system